MRLVEKEACCGMPKLELGDLDGVKSLKNSKYSPLGKTGEGRVCNTYSCTIVHADVQAGTAAHVS